MISIDDGSGTQSTLNFTDRCTLSWQDLNVHQAEQSHTNTYSYNFMDNPWLLKKNQAQTVKVWIIK